MEKKVEQPAVKQEPEQVKTQQIIARPDIQTLFIDNFLMHKTADNHIILSGIQNSPGMSVEQMRCTITSAHAIRLAEKLLEIAAPKKVEVVSEAKPVIPENTKKKTAGKKK